MCCVSGMRVVQEMTLVTCLLLAFALLVGKLEFLRLDLSFLQLLYENAVGSAVLVLPRLGEICSPSRTFPDP